VTAMTDLALTKKPSWPGVSRPSTKMAVDARHKAGHDAMEAKVAA